MKVILIIFILSTWPFVSRSFANFPEFFGASPSSAALGNQFTLSRDSAANNYFFPALIASAEKVSLSLSSSIVQTSFASINNVRIKNSLTDGTILNGAVDTDYGSGYFFAFHAVLPIMRKRGGKLGISLFSPIGYYAETNSGDSLLPEYVMYRSRYKRNSLYVNYAYPLNESFAFSLGVHTGFQVSADVYHRASLNGSDKGTLSRIKSKIKPSFGAILSGSYAASEDTKINFAYQQEMKSNFEITSYGEIESPNIPFDIGPQSMIYYDPHIFRLGAARSYSKRITLYSTLEYQLWDKYKTPVIRVKKNAGVIKASDDFEVIFLKNIFVPKIGIQFSLTPRFNISGGLFYRPTPLKGNFSNAGNSVDTDVTVICSGVGYQFRWDEREITLSTSLQYHILKDKKVNKSSNMENGDTAESKIGAPGYSVGGYVVAGSFGLSMSI